MQAGFADGFAAAGGRKQQQRKEEESHTPQINADQRRFNAGEADCVLAMAKADSTSSQNWPQSWSWERCERRSCWASWPISSSWARSVVKKVWIAFSAAATSPWERCRPKLWRARGGGI